MPTIYITQEDTALRKKGERLIVKKGKEKIADIPLIKVDQVVVFGEASISGSLISLLSKAEVPITYLSYYGKYKGRLVPEYSKNSLLRIKQFENSRNEKSKLEFARQIVKGKLSNMRTLLMRDTRGNRSKEAKKACDKLKNIIDKLSEVNDIEKLRGFEGLGSRHYFSQFDSVLNNEFEFSGRNRRPPRDPVNCLLSFGYSLLLNDVLTGLYLVGFDPYIGFFHSNQYGKPSLALDLMEEFRPVIIDSVVKTMINKKIVSQNDFKEVCGTVKMKDNLRNDFLEQYEKRLRTKFTHPIFEYEINWRRCIELQARLISKFINEEISEYPPLVVK
ncbi:type I-D CRISPR-associated endonuclease Cas1d [Halanaerobacter jeridensis]|uniref:CRISPR-associated endonuclease Cas1 n=1 Tax=Halanaerobacter jeridensis TaxID=706427 RepID=A0A938XQT4_9FIRM|nr:type I-D CRISPR-associated endonuclease Cas1d [Halanaerobacter jeridensis]MBM7555648.1 CRISPR-associated protein Cas1 [Halanaerobacter jeridensis]